MCIRDRLYPIRITTPKDVVSKLLPVMQVGLHAASLVNGVSGVVRLFGFPCPKVPEAWRAGAQDSVEILKQESSVEAFGAVHEKAMDGGEETETVRGAGLRELEAFYAKYDPDREYAGLRRIGDEDGTAVWTLLTDPEEVKAVLEARARERRTEARRHDNNFIHSLFNRKDESLPNMARLLNGDLSALDDDSIKKGFFQILTMPSYADRLEDSVRKTPELADLTNDKGQRAIELACLELSLIHI